MKILNKFFLIFILITMTSNGNNVFYLSHNDPELLSLINNFINNCLDKIYSHEKKFAAGAKYYHDVSNLIKKNNLKIGAEIGVLYAGNSECILKNANVNKLYSVDPYDPNFFGGKLKADLLYLKAKKRLGRFNQSQLIRKSSKDAALLFRDGSLDFVFIDADHSYESAKQDINLWYKKVRDGGLVIGDDYAKNFPGVIKAVNELGNMTKKEVKVLNNRIWYIIK